MIGDYIQQIVHSFIHSFYFYFPKQQELKVQRPLGRPNRYRRATGSDRLSDLPR